MEPAGTGTGLVGWLVVGWLVGWLDSKSEWFRQFNWDQAVTRGTDVARSMHHLSGRTYEQGYPRSKGKKAREHRRCQERKEE